MNNFPFKVGDTVTKISGRDIHTDVKIKAIFPNVSEITVENWRGITHKCAFSEVENPQKAWRNNFALHSV